MNHKISLLLAMVVGQGMMGGSYAHSPTPQKPIQFYAGLSGGVEQMRGWRSDRLDEEDIANPPDRLQTIYTQNLRMSQANPAVSIMGGFLWKIPTVPLLVGPEVYFGRGSTISSVKDNRPDPFAALGLGDTRSYATDFQRKFFYGILLRAGYRFCEKYLAYVSLGVDRSQFDITGLVNLFPGSRPLVATMLKKTKSFNGAVFGIGLEKQFNHLKVGIDFRMIQYQRQTIVNGLNQPAGFAPASVILIARPTIYSAALRICYQF